MLKYLDFNKNTVDENRKNLEKELSTVPNTNKLQKRNIVNKICLQAFFTENVQSSQIARIVNIDPSTVTKARKEMGFNNIGHVVSNATVNKIFEKYNLTPYRSYLSEKVKHDGSSKNKKDYTHDTIIKIMQHNKRVPMKYISDYITNVLHLNKPLERDCLIGYYLEANRKEVSICVDYIFIAYLLCINGNIPYEQLKDYCTTYLKLHCARSDYDKAKLLISNNNKDLTYRIEENDIMETLKNQKIPLSAVTDFEDNVYDLLTDYNSNVVKDIPLDFGSKIEETETKPVDNMCTEPVKSETLTDEISKIAIKAIESKEYDIAYKLIAILTENVQ